MSVTDARHRRSLIQALINAIVVGWPRSNATPRDAAKRLVARFYFPSGAESGRLTPLHRRCTESELVRSMRLE